MLKRSFSSRIHIHPKFPEDTDWGEMYDENAARCAQGIAEFIRNQVQDREYAKIEGLREALRFIAAHFN